MNWRFTITDRAGTKHIIDEPVGFDSINIDIKRDLDVHGIFFDFQGNDFKFYGVEKWLMKDEYEAYGVQGIMMLKIEEACEDGVYEFLYEGRLLFTKYDFVCGDECYVKLPMETTSDIMELRNRFDQKVDLQTAVAFDGTTPLPAYDYLPTDLLLDSKGILLQDSARNEAINTTPILGAVNYNGGYETAEIDMIEVPYDKTVASEIGGFYAPPQAIATSIVSSNQPNSINGFNVPMGGYGAFVAPLEISPSINYAKGLPNFGDINATVELSLHVKGRIKLIASYFESASFFVMRLPEGADGDKLTDYDVIFSKVLFQWAGGIFPEGMLPPGTTLEFDINYSNPLFNLNEGDRIYHFFSIAHEKTEAQRLSEVDAYTIEFDADNFFLAKTLSHTPPTYTKAFMVNEALSRIAEGITNNKIKAYSEYFGRTDSQPYSHASDGCGSLEAITKGLFIRRQENRISTKPFKIALSLKDMWEGLDPIHHLGYGVEEDPARDGFNRLRTEPWKFFYKTEVIMDCVDVNRIERKVIENEHYSTFKFGYNKWEAEEYNGLDEFLTKRLFRTALSEIKNELNKTSSFVASGYAWEITRRKGDIDSKDWRYDNETFIVCLKRSDYITYATMFSGNVLILYNTTEIPAWATAGGVIHIEAMEPNGNDILPIPANTGDYTIASASVYQGVSIAIQLTSAFPVFKVISYANISGNGIKRMAVEVGNVTNPQHIIDPPTLYNYRISPIRNAMRWMDKVLASYRRLNANSKIIFMDGDGNYYASGEMESTVCKWENQELAENNDLNITYFKEGIKGAPLMRPERVVFDYPMSVKEFKDVKANPYGLIAFSSDCEEGEGWIDDVNYKPEEGMASFNLIPRYLSVPITGGTGDFPVILQEDGTPILQQSGLYTLPE